MRRKPMKGVELDQTPAYAERLREVMSDMATPHTPVHIEGGPCANDAPSWHKFTADTLRVTCEVCLVTIAVVDGDEEEQRRPNWVRDERVQEALAGDPDPYALALYKAKHAGDCTTCKGTGLKPPFHSVSCPSCDGSGKSGG